MNGFLTELKRRHVARAAVLYVVGSWGALQIASLAFELLDVPGWALKLVFGALLAGLPLVLAFAWAYEVTPEGVRRSPPETERSPSPARGRVDLAIAGLALLGVAVVAVHALREEETPKPLRAVPGPALGPASVAVLPFASLGEGPENAWFADGLHDELLTRLTQAGGLKVISRSSVLEYRDGSRRLPEIAAELGVASLVEGTVQRADGRVRVTVQLVDAATDTQLWAERYDRALSTESLLDIRADVAERIATALSARAPPGERQRIARPPTASLAAYDQYLRGIGIFGARPDRAGLRIALEALGQAVAHDPGFAEARVALAEVLLSWYWSYDRDATHLRAAGEHLAAAEADDPASPDLHRVLALYHYWGFRDYARALEELRFAAEAMPADGRLPGQQAIIERRMGRFDDALVHHREGIRLNPRDPRAQLDYVGSLVIMRRYEEVGAELAHAARLGANPHWIPYMEGLLALLAEGDAAGCLARLDESVRRDPHPEARWLQWYCAWLAGEPGAAMAAADWPGIPDNSRLAYPAALARGLVAAERGRADRAAKELARAEAELRQAIEAKPDDYRLQSALGVTLAALGRQGEALSAALTARDRMPVSWDAFDGPDYALEVGWVRLMGGDEAGALSDFAALLAVPGHVSLPSLLLDPRARGLLDAPGFSALAAAAAAGQGTH